MTHHGPRLPAKTACGPQASQGKVQEGQRIALAVATGKL